MKRNLILILQATLLAIAPAQEIKIAFHNGTTTSGAMATRPAGTLVNTAASPWNNVINNGGSGLTFSNFTLVNATGADSGAKLAVTAGFSGFNSIPWGSNSQDWVMMEGWYGFRATEAIIVSNLPASFAGGFSVVVYGDSNANGRTMNYRIGGQTKTLVDNGNFSGTFTENTHFVTFNGLNGTSFTLEGNPNAADPRSSVNGVVIVPGTLPDPPVVTSFSADDHYVSPGATATLSWQTTGADSVSISPGIGSVAAGGGSVPVVVQETTTFTLTATNVDGQTVSTLRVGAGPPRPNILFVLVDDMGWQDTSVPFLHDPAGNPVVTPLNQRYRTPGMATLASRGIKFTNAYAMPVCTPSRTCWMTGLNSARHRVTNWTNLSGTDNDENSTTSHNSPADWTKGGLPPSRVTLPSLLQAAGYRTIHAGKAHFGATSYARLPTKVGFDVNIAGSEIGHPASYFGTANFGTGGNHVPGLESYHGQDIFLTEALTLEMKQAIESAVEDGAPFFAYMAHYAVHSPFQTDPRFAANYPGLSGSELAFATLIEGMDKSLADLLVKLEQLGVAEDTLVVFMSDNGGDAPFADVNQSNAPLRHKKGSKYEGGIREPMIVAWAKPDSTRPFQAALPILPGSREDDLVAIFDFYPTFAAVAGVAAPNDLDGHDLTPYFRAEPGTHRPQELLIHYPHDHRSDYFTVFRENEWKLIYNYASNSYELYNLAADLSEGTNLSTSQPERVMAMARKMARQLADAGAQWPTLAAGGAADHFSTPSLPVVDVDGDGIPDNTEDPNSNGLVDAGETDPDAGDSDGDSTLDGDEIRTGTNPLDGTSFFRAIPRESDGRFVIRWPSKPGASYRIETSATLNGAWSIVADNVPASSGSETDFDTGDIDTRAFFRVALK